jgi:RNA polymerase sigma-70 factor, ECF subfamily
MADGHEHGHEKNLVQPTLAALFADARAGNEAAQRQLCERMQVPLYRVAYAIVHDTHAAQDLAQEAMLRILTKSALFAGLGSLEGWMLRIARHAALNHRRDHARRQQILQHSAHELRPPAHTDPDPQVQQREQLLRAVERLSPRQREVVELRAIAGLSFAQVAATLRISEANARMHFSLAKKALTSLELA